MQQMLKNSVSALFSVASAVGELEDKPPGRGARGVKSNAFKRKGHTGWMRTGFKWLSASEVTFPNASLRAIASISWDGPAFFK